MSSHAALAASPDALRLPPRPFSCCNCAVAAPDALPSLVLAKVREQIERTEHLIALIPPDRLAWKPDIPGARSIAELLGHLLDCLAGFCAALYAFDPVRLARFAGLRGRKVNHACGTAEALDRVREYAGCIEEGFALLTGQDLVRPVKTVFVPQGEPLLTLLLGNLEHLINHKHQLFFYLKLLGAPVSTADLYRLRGPAPATE